MNISNPGQANTVLNTANVKETVTPPDAGSAPPKATQQTLMDDTVTISSEAVSALEDGVVSTQSAGGTTLPGWPPKKTS